MQKYGFWDCTSTTAVDFLQETFEGVFCKL